MYYENLNIFMVNKMNLKPKDLITKNQEIYFLYKRLNFQSIYEAKTQKVQQYCWTFCMKSYLNYEP